MIEGISRRFHGIPMEIWKSKILSWNFTNFQNFTNWKLIIPQVKIRMTTANNLKISLFVCILVFQFGLVSSLVGTYQTELGAYIAGGAYMAGYNLASVLTIPLYIFQTISCGVLYYLNWPFIYFLSCFSFISDFFKWIFMTLILTIPRLILWGIKLIYGLMPNFGLLDLLSAFFSFEGALIGYVILSIQTFIVIVFVWGIIHNDDKKTAIHVLFFFVTMIILVLLTAPTIHFFAGTYDGITNSVSPYCTALAFYTFVKSD